jgi:nitrite reductase/ring-hydroxylating ferredoxin subunit
MQAVPASAVHICGAAELEDGGRGVRFPLTAWGEQRTGFVVRYRGQVHAFLNRCAHVPVELDWNEGDFFDSSGTYLMCSTHGALYLPDSGHCAGGPCRGGKLQPISVLEIGGEIYWEPDDSLRPVLA